MMLESNSFEKIELGIHCVGFNLWHEFKDNNIKLDKALNSARISLNRDLHLFQLIDNKENNYYRFVLNIMEILDCSKIKVELNYIRVITFQHDPRIQKLKYSED